jgi:hypothetical protein
MHRYFSPIKFRYGSNFDIQRTTNGFNKSCWSIFSPDRDEFSNAKDGKLVAKRKRKAR